MLPVRRYFISCASAEFRSYREMLRTHLTSATAEVKVQEDFTNGPSTLLEKLDDYVAQASAVLHLVGKWAGSKAKPAEVRKILERYSDFLTVLSELSPSLDPDNCPFTYTQWEAFLAIYHRVPCFIYIAGDGTTRERDWKEDAVQTAQQDLHIVRLRSLGKDRVTVPFADPKDVAISFLNSLQDDVTGASLGKAEVFESEIHWPPLALPTTYQLADRHDEMSLFVLLVSEASRERILLLHGPSDRGKSSLLTAIEELVISQKSISCGRGDFRNGQSLRDTLSNLTSELKEIRFARFDREVQRNSVESLRAAFLKDLSEANRPVVLVLDTWEDATDEARLWVEQQLFSMVRRSAGLRVVVAGQKVPKFSGQVWEKIAICRELPPITEAAHWCQFARRNLKLRNIPDEHIETLVKAVKGSPRPLSMMLSNLQEGGC